VIDEDLQITQESQSISDLDDLDLEFPSLTFNPWSCDYQSHLINYSSTPTLCQPSKQAASTKSREGNKMLLYEPLAPNLITASAAPPMLSGSITQMDSNDTPLAPTVSHSGSLKDFGDLLSLCLYQSVRFSSLLLKIVIDDKEFCAVTMTSDFDINPFRCRRETSNGSLYLLHAMLATSCHYLDRSTLSDGRTAGNGFQHWKRAVRLYKDAVDSNPYGAKALTLLDTALILYTLDVSIVLAVRASFHSYLVAGDSISVWKLDKPSLCSL
jgi:hypothetical protein